VKGKDREKRRGLSKDDRALWAQVVRAIKPLPSSRRQESLQEAHQEEPRRGEARPALHNAKGAVEKPTPPALAPFDRRLRQRLARGTKEIDARLDLHGLTQAEARERLIAFLEKAQARERALVLVITGKGAGGSADRLDNERGVLRRQVPMWLALPEFRPLVIGFEEAGIAHGGAGALYVRIRRKR
jgi:DNA-nicking Smr family endonuclease